MSGSMLVAVAVFVFVMMLIGLGLTVWEFRYGQPRSEDKQSRQREGSAQPRRPVKAAEGTAR